jgi:hypothetical protein
MDEIDEMEAAYQRSLLPPEERGPEPEPLPESVSAIDAALNDFAGDVDFEEVSDDVTVPAPGIISSLSEDDPWVSSGSITSGPGTAGQEDEIARLREEIKRLKAVATPLAVPLDTHILENTNALDIVSTNIVKEFWYNRTFWVPKEKIVEFIASSPAPEGEVMSEKVLWPKHHEDQMSWDTFVNNEEDGVENTLVQVVSNDGLEIIFSVFTDYNYAGSLSYTGQNSTPFLLRVSYSEINAFGLISFNTYSDSPDNYGYAVDLHLGTSEWSVYNSNYIAWRVQRIEAEKKKVEMIKKLSESLELTYPGKWDFLKYEECGETIKRGLRDELGSDNVNTGLFPVVHFDDFTISNSHGESREITNLFVLMPFKEVNGEYKSTGKLLGTRSSLTGNEYSRRYSHSHLPTCLKTFRRFCLGGGTPMAIMMSELSMSFNMMNFEFMLNQLDSYVRHESISGGPHIRMQNIDTDGNSMRSNISRSSCNAVYSRVLAQHALLGTTPNMNVDDNGDFSIDILDTEFQDNVLLSVPDDRNKASLTPEGEFMPMSSSGRNYIVDSINLSAYQVPLFKFKGNQIINKILPNPAVAASANNRIVPHKDILEYIAKRLAMESQEYLLNKTEDEYS